MRLFLGLFLFSVLLTTGASLKCETCFSDGQYCLGRWQKCGAGEDTCIIIVKKVTVAGTTAYSVRKGCDTKAYCYANMNQDVSGADIVTKMVCSKAAMWSGSLLLSLLGFLLLKMLL